MDKQVGDKDPHYKYPQVKPCRDPEKPGYIMNSSKVETVAEEVIKVNRVVVEEVMARVAVDMEVVVVGTEVAAEAMVVVEVDLGEEEAEV